MPFPEEQGVLARPGELISLGLKKVGVSVTSEKTILGH